jgi:hypothetical protein
VSGSERVSRRTAIDPLATARGSVGAPQTRTPPKRGAYRKTKKVEAEGASTFSIVAYFRA